jgi:hypothetical protein
MTDFLTTTHRNVAWFKKTAQDGELVIRPRYQRNPVWLKPQKSSLIDTILRGYPVPELYMQEIVESDGSVQHVVVDGQQRIMACLEFVSGEFEIAEKESEQWGGLTFSDLSEEEQRSIWKYSLVVRLLPNIPESEVKEIFARLNRYNMALNKQELRHATYWGEFIKCVEGIAEADFWGESGIFSANDVRRMLDVEYISELAVGVLHGPQNKKNSLDRWYKVYEAEFPDRHLIEEVFSSVLGELGQVLPDMRHTRWRRSSDFYTLFLVFANHIEDLPLNREERDLAQEKLTSFGEDVTTFLAADNPGKANATVAKYGKAVARAATDLANRTERAKQLEAVLKHVFD